MLYGILHFLLQFVAPVAAIGILIIIGALILRFKE